MEWKDQKIAAAQNRRAGSGRHNPGFIVKRVKIYQRLPCRLPHTFVNHAERGVAPFIS